jgi:hypothetical protein
MSGSSRRPVLSMICRAVMPCSVYISRAWRSSVARTPETTGQTRRLPGEVGPVRRPAGLVNLVSGRPVSVLRPSACEDVSTTPTSCRSTGESWFACPWDTAQCLSLPPRSGT